MQWGAEQTAVPSMALRAADSMTTFPVVTRTTPFVQKGNVKMLTVVFKEKGCVSSMVVCAGGVWCSGLVPPALSFLLVVLLSPSCATLALPQASLQTTTQAGAKCVCLCVTEATLEKEEP